jgi:hypothetical protein
VNADAWKDLEETLLEVSIATSSSIETILDMDVLSFVALAEVVSRVSSRHKYESAWAAMIAAQGTKESMEKLTKPWNPDAVKTGDDFLREMNLSNGGSI